MTTNIAARMRAHIATNPGCTSHDVARNVDHASVDVQKALAKMTQRGILRRVGVPGSFTYFIAREMLADRTSSREELAARKKARKLAADAVRREKARALRLATVAAKPAKEAPAPIVAESVEEWLAKGGRPVVIPAQWARPNYRQLGAGVLF